MGESFFTQHLTCNNFHGICIKWRVTCLKSVQHKLSNEWSHDLIWDRIQKFKIFWSTGTLTTIYGDWGLGPLWGVPTQLICLICVLHWKWPLLNWWPKKFFLTSPLYLVMCDRDGFFGKNPHWAKMTENGQKWLKMMDLLGKSRH